MSKKIYTCKGFTGHYPVGTSAIVSAESASDAAKLLNIALIAGGLKGDAKPSEMVIFHANKESVRVLNDGNY